MLSRWVLSSFSFTHYVPVQFTSLANNLRRAFLALDRCWPFNGSRSRTWRDLGALCASVVLTRARFDGQYRNAVAGIISYRQYTGARNILVLIDVDVYVLPLMEKQMTLLWQRREACILFTILLSGKRWYWGYILEDIYIYLTIYVLIEYCLRRLYLSLCAVCVFFLCNAFYVL